jgi:hypothetical protein
MGAGRGVGLEGVRLRDEGVATLATRIVSRAPWWSRRGVLEVVVGCAAVVRWGLSGIVSSFLRFADRGDSIVWPVCCSVL